MVEDTFGMPIKKGNIVLLSKGDRGHKDFEKGIVREFFITPKQIWLKTVVANKNYYERNDPNAIPHLWESKHLVVDGINLNIVLISDIDSKKVVADSYLNAVNILKASGEFPATYVLGASIEQEEKEVEKEISIEKISLSLDMLADLGMPSSLKKD